MTYQTKQLFNAVPRALGVALSRHMDIPVGAPYRSDLLEEVCTQTWGKELGNEVFVIADKFLASANEDFGQAVQLAYTHYATTKNR